MVRRPLRLAPIGLLGTLLWAGAAPAQDVGGGQSDGNAGPAVTAADSDGNPVTISGTIAPPTTTETTTIYTPYGVPGPGANPDAHLPRGSQSVVDINSSRSEFDYDSAGAGGSGVVRGNKDGAAILKATPASSAPSMHQVKKGDTLWDLSAAYYDNPWMWPKLWSYNPQIQNPHWIYPGDQLAMRPGGAQDGPASRSSVTLGGGDGGGQRGLINRRPVVPGGTVFLRNSGYIDDPKKDVWGELVGSREEQMLLSEGNHVYMIMRPGVELEKGQLLTVFRPVRPPSNVKGARKPKGEIVSFKGTVEIDEWDPKTRVARGKLVESIDVVERGAKIGPVGRRFEVVAPQPNQVDLWARVLTSIYPHEIMGQHQVVFIDRGEKDGLQAGNRLFIVERGDMWRKTLRTATKMARGRVRTDVPEHVKVEYTPLHGDQEKFPEEVVGEIRVIRASEDTSLAVVTVSHREIEPGDRVVARKGY